MEIHTAQLVAITPEAERRIVHMARVSNPSNQGNPQTSQLIRYLIAHGHWSPFEMASLQIQVDTTRAITAQLLRHRSFSFQEFSQRYSAVTALPPIQLPRLRRQDPTNRQASHDDLDPQAAQALHTHIQAAHAASLACYAELLAAGVAKECARAVLPLGTPTRLYMSGTIRSFLHYCAARCGPETQHEHRLVATAIRSILATELPAVSAAFFGGTD